MATRRVKPKSISEYFRSVPADARKKLRELRHCIRLSAPGATESLKWGIPAFSYERILVMYAAHAQHIGFYPTPSAIAMFRNELRKYHVSRGAVRFPLDRPLPLLLIKRMTRYRVRESRQYDGLWISKK